MIRIDAATRWNYTGYPLRKGLTYRFVVPPGQTWRDWYVISGPDGYSRWYLAPFIPLLRVTSTVNGRPRFFTLIGAVGPSVEDAFIIGNGTTHTATADGELVCFANDVPWAYSNNRGAILFSVDSLS
jgi:hypothetical protein